MGVRSRGDALSLILCDGPCLPCPEMPPLGAQGTPALRQPPAAVTDCHLVVALIREAQQKEEEQPPPLPFFSPKLAGSAQGRFASQGAGPRDGSEPHHRTDPAAAWPRYGPILSRQAGKSSLRRKQVDRNRNIMLLGLPVPAQTHWYLAIHASKWLPSKPRRAPHATLAPHTRLKGFSQASHNFGLTLTSRGRHAGPAPCGDARTPSWRLPNTSA